MDSSESAKEFSERDVIKNFLTEIKDDIESIDCGCSDCIGSFISGVNTVIKKYGLELKLNGESSVCSLGLDLIDKIEQKGEILDFPKDEKSAEEFLKVNFGEKEPKKQEKTEVKASH